MIEPKEFKKVIGKDEYLFRVYEKCFLPYRVSKKARWWLVSEWWIWFNGEEDCEKKINEFSMRVMEKQIRKENYKKERLERDKKEKKDMIDSINVWDLLRDSWWYDMTINDFLQVCDKKGNKVFCRAVSKECVSGDNGFTGTERPVKDSFIDEGKWYVIGKYWIRLNDYRHARKGEWNEDYYFNYMD